MLKNLGKVYVMIGVLLFTILILNLIIAILSNTYNIFDPKSKGLYLSKILSSRDELSYDENYGAFLTGMSPLNLILLPFVPIALIIPPNPRFNKAIMILQYLVLMAIMFCGFVLFSAILLPFAYLKSLVYKLQQIFKTRSAISICKAMIFIFLGVPIMLTSFISDCVYFWINNFRSSNLKKIVIEIKPSSITN